MKTNSFKLTTEEQSQKPSKMQVISNFRHDNAFTVNLTLFSTYPTFYLTTRIVLM